VTVPAGALLRMRINQTLTSASAKAGDRFDGIVVSDVVAGGAVAIPRGATVQGTVVDAKKSGALAGRGELTLQLTQVTLGGVSTALVSDVWGRTTGDKAAQAVNSTAVGGVIGALLGARRWRRGAAIGAGVGGALGWDRRRRQAADRFCAVGGAADVPSGTAGDRHDPVAGGDGPAGSGSSSGSAATATPAALSCGVLRAVWAGLLSALSLWLSLSLLKRSDFCVIRGARLRPLCYALVPPCANSVSIQNMDVKLVLSA